MSDRSEDPEIELEEEIDPGEPLAALARLEHDVSDDLLTRIRCAVQRRTNARQLASFAINIPLALLRELWSVLINRPDPLGIRKDASHGDKTS
jgi:hypothetical protein